MECTEIAGVMREADLVCVCFLDSLPILLLYSLFPNSTAHSSSFFVSKHAALTHPNTLILTTKII